MKLFISWSGEPSHTVALHLRDWLPVALPFVQPWVSSEDIPKGARWGTELADQLEGTHSGVVCLVPGNANEPWLNFEAGALSKVVDKARVHTFCIGIVPRDLPGCLAQFQATRFDKDDIRKLILDLNSQAGPAALPEARVRGNFEVCWPDFERRISKLASGTPAPAILETTVVQTPPPLELTEEELQVLVGIADAGDGLRREDAGELFRMHAQKAQHIMEQLEQKGLLSAAHNYVYGTRWSLNRRGRAFLASNDLL